VLLGNLALFLGGLVAGWALARKGLLAPESGAPASLSPLVGAVARDVGAKASRSEVERLRAEIEALARQVDAVQGHLKAPSRPEPVPDLGPLRSQLEDLARVSARLAPLPEQLQALDERVGALDKALGTLSGEVASLREQSRAAIGPPARADELERVRGEGVTDWVGARGTALFAEGKYAEARNVFLKHAEAHPDDARLWYGAALANGLATRDWRGDSERLVKMGLEREQAGTPGRAEIEAHFADLSRTQGREWLAWWRKRLDRP
jgi:hypothetical protein